MGSWPAHRLGLVRSECFIALSARSRIGHGTPLTKIHDIACSKKVVAQKQRFHLRAEGNPRLTFGLQVHPASPARTDGGMRQPYGTISSTTLAILYWGKAAPLVSKYTA